MSNEEKAEASRKATTVFDRQQTCRAVIKISGQNNPNYLAAIGKGS